MEEDNYLNSHGAKKQSFQNDNMEKVNVASLAGSMAPNLQPQNPSRFGMQQFGNQLKASLNSSKIPKKIISGMHNALTPSLNPQNDNIWITPESVGGNSGAFTLNQTNAQGNYGLQGAGNDDSKHFH